MQTPCCSCQTLTWSWCSLGLRDDERTGLFDKIDVEARDKLSIAHHKLEEFVQNIIGVRLLTLPFPTKTKNGRAFHTLAIIRSKCLRTVKPIFPVNEEVFTEHRPRQRSIVGGGLPEVTNHTIGSSHPHHPHGGPHPLATGGRMIAVVAVTGEDMTGGVSADGEHDARREPLPVEKIMKSTGDMAVIVHCVYPHRTAGAVAVMTVSVMHRGTGCLKPAANSVELKSMNLALNPCTQKRTFFCCALSPRGSVCLDGFVPAF